ncbi:MAG: flagellar hook-basal body protein [Ignavibacterium album]|uniref:Flagellar hook-basal body protein n=1 Tax=Ignavibacterium album TaxID=591197 RepID=A0A7V2ZI86_9BACT|nr:flagellar hook-basal body protein [Ignavibacterium album]MCX8106345.1 flagellar hook-basal body protein [Ignavibacterium album]
MIKGIYHAARSLETQNKNLERIANNLANLNTVGYKREGMFIQILNQLGLPQVKSPVDMSQGELVETKNPLDLAIVGVGLFVVKTEKGFEFVRNGNFQISEEGFLVDKEGRKVIGKNGEINLSEYQLDENNLLSISRNGEIKVGENVVDNLLIAKLNEDTYEQRKEGLNFDSISDIQELSEEGEYQILQGYLEESNVNPIQEMENMIRVSKDYESSYKMVISLDESLQKSVEIGKI